MLGYARPDRPSSPLVGGTTCLSLIGAAVELLCIFIQAARGRQSRFNFQTAVDTVISVIMAITAVLFIGTVLPPLRHA
ncbi:hypothetical protein LFL96_35940 (plasmid) [Paraburkholderia sp. D15]|uniref:hypothetical protein n=1 Tax=Paraburkholderia sp. D15 TaxID=2880218 RepID=UPI002478E4FE|nr:hypothetical protein [Paraburkholderia sp. D15]WGS54893.1 hypothetical protein LFL96_35940 [Paraburkholderia sp. D15]